MPVHRLGKLAKLEAALRLLRRVVDQVDAAGPKWQARVRTGNQSSVRGYWRRMPRCSWSPHRWIDSWIIVRHIL